MPSIVFSWFPLQLSSHQITLPPFTLSRPQKRAIMSSCRDPLLEDEVEIANQQSSLSLFAEDFYPTAQASAPAALGLDPTTIAPMDCFLPARTDQGPLGLFPKESHPTAQPSTSTTLGQKRAPAASEQEITKKPKYQEQITPLVSRNELNSASPCGASTNTPESLACPFYKKDPERHADCSKFKFKNCNRTRQHIERRHTDTPAPYRCSNCFTEWNPNNEKSEKSYIEHVRREGGCVTKPPPELSVEAFERLKLMPRGLKDETKKWNWIFGQLFPHSAVPKSPHVQDVTTERALSLLQLGQPRLESMLPTLLAQHGCFILPKDCPSLATSICRVLQPSSSNPQTHQPVGSLEATHLGATPGSTSYQGFGDMADPGYMGGAMPFLPGDMGTTDDQVEPYGPASFGNGDFDLYTDNGHGLGEDR
ncbi:hypothetical protein B0T10DRAFT_579728 [Thelonectria olida]|uniref:C2H2-type domain-containing protein n=1 Tax=Thelonectria olida TaxID=1576542 RepID=A0A9P8W093_9HYPO|nr:hypothetical protein B0T10DRAFT_579728 [Thelonectria olida]